MKHEKIGDDARVWVVTRGPNGRLQPRLDRQLLEALNPGMDPAEIADAIAIAAGTAEIAETRIW